LYVALIKIDAGLKQKMRAAVYANGSDSNMLILNLSSIISDVNCI